MPPGYPQPPAYPGKAPWEGGHGAQHGHRDSSPSKRTQSPTSSTPTDLESQKSPREKKMSGTSLQESRQPKPYMKRAKTFNVPCTSEDYLNPSWSLQGHKSSSLTKINEGQLPPGERIVKPAATSQNDLYEMQNKPIPPAKDETDLGPSRAERIAQYKELRRKELAEIFGGMKPSSFESPLMEKQGKYEKKSRKESKEEKPSAIANLATAALPFAAIPSAKHTPTSGPASSRAVIASMHERGIFSPPPLMSREIGVFSPPPRVTHHEYGVFSPPPSLMSSNRTSPNILRSETSPAPVSDIQKPTVTRSKTNPESVPYPFALTPAQAVSAGVPSASGYLTSGHSEKSPFAPPVGGAAHMQPVMVGSETQATTSIVTPNTTSIVSVTASFKSPLSSSMTSVAASQAEKDHLIRRTGSLDRTDKRFKHYTPLSQRMQEKRDKLVEADIGRSSSLPRHSRSSRIGGDRQRLAEPPQLYTRSKTEPAIPENPASSPPAILPIQTVAPSMTTIGTQTPASIKSSMTNIDTRGKAEKGVQSPPPARTERFDKSVHRQSEHRKSEAQSDKSKRRNGVDPTINDMLDKISDIKSPTLSRHGIKPEVTLEITEKSKKDKLQNKAEVTSPVKQSTESFTKHSIQKTVDDHIREATSEKCPQGARPASDKEREITPPFPLTLNADVITAPSSRGPMLERRQKSHDATTNESKVKLTKSKSADVNKSIIQDLAKLEKQLGQSKSTKGDSKKSQPISSDTKKLSELKSYKQFVISPTSERKLAELSRKSPPKNQKAYLPEGQAQIAPSQKQISKAGTNKISNGNKKHRKLMREDSFNRPDSPVREPLPLPKDSVIGRIRKKRDLSSSSDDTPTMSPVVSPRASRRQKRQQAKTEGALLNVPGSPEKKYSK